MSYPRPPLEQRFREKFLPEPNTGCWLWTGAIHHGGYGVIWRDGRNHHAHRISYELHIGPIPDDLFVCHTCDVRICVNPDHLWLGTALDNNRDRERKGRGNPPSLKGERAPAAKLTRQDVIDIRRSREPHYVLAARYGMSRSALRAARAGQSWSHLNHIHPPTPPTRGPRRLKKRGTR